MNKDEKAYIEDKLVDYRDRVARLSLEPRRKPDPYADGFIRGLMLVINDLEGLRTLEKRP